VRLDRPLPALIDGTTFVRRAARNGVPGERLPARRDRAVGARELRCSASAATPFAEASPRQPNRPDRL